MRTRNLIKICLLLLIVSAVIFSCFMPRMRSQKKPNILIIYVDDLGYGDLSCYGATAVQTPNIDALAKKGVKFTDAHCSASTCTPSRFALLTGSYAFRNDAAILPGDAPLLISPKKETIASMLRKAGYATGVIGKWHLGLGDGKPDWNAEVKPGPMEIGFDYSFLIPATPDRVPTVFVEGHKVVNLDHSDPIAIDYSKRIGNDPVGLEHPELLKMRADTQHSGTIVNGISRIGYMSGGHTAYWRDEDFSIVLNEKANEFISSHKDGPFFLYYSLPGIHVPRAPNARFRGATHMGPRGDDIAEVDWMTGEVMRTLQKWGLENNTLIIFSSDNGPVLNDGYDDQAVELLGDHRPAGIYKGGKYSAYEGGTRVPFITCWPGQVQASESNALLGQVDLLGSLADLVGIRVDHRLSAPDSKHLLPVLLGRSKEGRKELLEESFTMALRSGDWKYIDPAKGKTPDWLRNKDVPTGLQSTPQLYNLEDDPNENNNLTGQYSDVAKKMAAELKKILGNK